MCESLAQHRETSTQGRQLQGVRKTKIKDNTVTVYWFFKSFVGLFQIPLLWQWDMQRPSSSCCFFFDFADNLIVTILFQIISFMSENDKLLGLRTPPPPPPPLPTYLAKPPVLTCHKYDMTLSSTQFFIRNEKDPWRSFVILIHASTFTR